MLAENFDFLFAIIILAAALLGFIKIALIIRKSGGTMTTTVHSALDSLYDKDKKKAAEMVAEQQANKKLEEQASSDPSAHTGKRQNQ